MSDPTSPAAGVQPNDDASVIPIKLAVSQDQFVFNDFFLYRTTEDALTPEEVVCSICDDYDLPTGIEDTLLEQMQAQLVLFGKGRRFYPDRGEMLHALVVDVWLDGFHILDKVLWDTNCSTDQPVTYARSLCGDLGLDDRYIGAVAHQIMLQLCMIERMRATHSDVELPTAHPLPAGGPLFRGFDSVDWAPKVEVAEAWASVPKAGEALVDIL